MIFRRKRKKPGPALLISLNGADNLLTGTIRTFTAGRRIELNRPPAPQVDSYLGLLRIRYSGTSPVEVHVGATDDYEASDGTLVTVLDTAGVAFTTAPAGEDRFVRFIDRCSRAASSAVHGSVTPVTDGELISIDPPARITGEVDLKELARTLRRALRDIERGAA